MKSIKIAIVGYLCTILFKAAMYLINFNKKQEEIKIEV